MKLIADYLKRQTKFINLLKKRGPPNKIHRKEQGEITSDTTKIPRVITITTNKYNQ